MSVISHRATKTLIHNIDFSVNRLDRGNLFEKLAGNSVVCPPSTLAPRLTSACTSCLPLSFQLSSTARRTVYGRRLAAEEPGLTTRSRGMGDRQGMGESGTLLPTSYFVSHYEQNVPDRPSRKDWHMSTESSKMVGSWLATDTCGRTTRAGGHFLCNLLSTSS